MKEEEFGVWLDEKRNVFWYSSKCWNYREIDKGYTYEFYRPSDRYYPSKYPLNKRFSGGCIVEW